MAYTEVRNIKGKKYYYRVISIRKDKKISKKRIYLGHDLSNFDILEKEKIADSKLLSNRIKKPNKEIEEIKSKIVPVLRKNKVTKAGIFGSYSRGEQKKNSDIDILINLPKNVSLFDFVGLKLKLEDILGKKVDLVEYSTIKPLIKQTILNEEIKIIWKETRNYF